MDFDIRSNAGTEPQRRTDLAEPVEHCSVAGHEEATPISGEGMGHTPAVACHRSSLYEAADHQAIDHRGDGGGPDIQSVGQVGRDRR